MRHAQHAVRRRRHSSRQTSNTAVRALLRYTKLHIARSTYTRATHYMYTVSVRAVLAIPHRPFMPICGEPATITAPISSSCHLIVMVGQVPAAIVRHRPTTAFPAHAEVSYSHCPHCPILRIVLLHGKQVRLFLSFPLPLLPLGFFTLSSQACLLFLAPLLLSACLLFPRRALALAGCFRLPHRSLCRTLQPEQIRFQSSSLPATLLCCAPGRFLKSCTHF